MNKEIIDNNYSKSKNSTLSNKFEFDKNLLKNLKTILNIIKNQEIEAHKTLESFTSKRGLTIQSFFKANRK